MSPRGPSKVSLGATCRYAGGGFLVGWYAIEKAIKQAAVIIGLFFAGCIARWQKPFAYDTSGKYIARFV